MHAYYAIMRKMLFGVHNFCFSSYCVFLSAFLYSGLLFKRQEISVGVSRSNQEIGMDVFLKKMLRIYLRFEMWSIHLT